jgi:hypothetical protein
VTIIAVHASSFIHQHNASLDVMLVYAFEATFFIFARFNHMIKIKALVALCDTTVLFKQFA